MKHNRIFVYTLLLVMLAGNRLEGQAFGAGIVAGLNASQIQGDLSGGYNKLGFKAGLRGIVRYAEKTEFGVDLLYSQRGSTNGLGANNINIRWVIRLDYVEVPVWFCYKDWLSEEGFYQVKVYAGLSYGRLFNVKMVDHPTFPDDQLKNMADNDLSFTLGLAYCPGRKFSMGLYFTRSVVPLYNNKKFINHTGLPEYELSVWGYFLSFQGVYEF